jgi:hypothetical protein
MKNIFILKAVQKNMALILFSILIIGCSKKNISEEMQNNAFSLTEPPHKRFKQLPETTYRPASYFTCDGIHNTCPPISNVGIKTSKDK